jgi:nitronate monooxygenase
MTTHPALSRATAFADRFGLRLPIALAPMAGACPPALSIAVANAGGLGAAGALLMGPEAIRAWAAKVRANTNGAFALNLWVPDPAPVRDAAKEAAVARFLSGFGPPVSQEAGNAPLQDFDAQCAALLDVGPAVVSSIMGLFPPDFVAEAKRRGISWWATATTVAEARAAQDAGADVIVAQGAEAGGHRGAFDASRAGAAMVGLFALLPAVVDATRVPVVAAGGVADGRAVAAALLMGASAVQMGTAFLRAPEAGIAQAWADALAGAAPEDTIATRAFSGRLGRALATDYARAAAAPDAPEPAPYPVQRGLTAAMREAATKANDLSRMQAWAGQSARLARAAPAGEIVRDVWAEAVALLR